MLAALEALDGDSGDGGDKAAAASVEKPAAREAMEQANDKAQAAIELHAERVRHRLLLDDGLLSARGLRPWEQSQNVP